MSSIYKLLRKLEKVGFVVRKDKISAQNRLRKTYAVSGSGRKALRKKLESLLSEPEHVRWRIDIGTYNSDLLPAPDVREALEKYRKAVAEKMKGYEDLLQFLKDSGCPQHRFGVAARPLFLLKGELQWVESFLSQIGPGSADPPR